MANVQAAVEVELFGTNLAGMVSKTTEGNQKTTEFLVMPSPLDENKPITIDNVVKEINETIKKIGGNGSSSSDNISADDIKNALSIVGLEDPALTFMQTFVHYKREVEIEAGGGEKELSKVTEYAVGIHIHGVGKDHDYGDFNFLNIKDVYINVWNTTKEKVLERMQIWSLDQLGE